jgi:hypothetical protein
MTTQSNHTAGISSYGRKETARDVLIVSSFGFWALLLGLAPVLAFHSLLGS